MRKISKTRRMMDSRKTIYYYDDGTRDIEYWESLDEFCNFMGIQ